MRALLPAALILLLGGGAAAQAPLDEALGGFDEDKLAPAAPADPLEGFDDDTPTAAPTAAPAAPPPADNGGFTASGALSQDAVFNFAHDAPAPGATDHRGLSGLRSRLDAQFELEFSDDWRALVAGYAFHDWAYGINGRDGYTPQVLDEYENDAALGEAWVQGRLGAGADLRVGRQVVVWGKSDAIRITDVLNPLDLRSPGRTDIGDLRLPATMTKLDFYAGDWNLGVIALHELRFNRLPAFGSDFFGGPAPLPPDGAPQEGFGAPEYALALNGIFTGWDLSFYGARIYDDRPHLEATPAGPRLMRSRLDMAGIAANAAVGSWLFKGEAAWFDGLQFSALPGQEFRRLDALVGVEYSGIADLSISLEAANRHIPDFDPALAAAPDYALRNDFETALRVTQKFMNDRLQLSLMASTHGLDGGNGGFQRVELVYDWTDSLEFSAGIINFMSGDKAQFQGMGDNDRLFAKVEYSF